MAALSCPILLRLCRTYSRITFHAVELSKHLNGLFAILILVDLLGDSGLSDSATILLEA